MAATGATRRTNHRDSSRRRLDRRGRHSATPTVDREHEGAASTTPAMHVTPNVVIAARGEASPGHERRPRRTLRSSALDLSRFRA